VPDTYQRLCSLLTSTFRIPEEQIEPCSTLQQLDLDSLALAELSLVIHEEFGVRITTEQATPDTTVADIIERLDAPRARTTETVDPS
jgi:acyl carrier protein